MRSKASGRAGPPSDQPVRPTRGLSSNSAAYIFPRHATEADRLDLQHYALHEALGVNYLAPVSMPHRVLDVGCGSGQWAYDLCSEYPEALVVGIDLVPSKPNRPPNYRFVTSNILQGLPFGRDRFDFVHQRLLVGGVPTNSWPPLVHDLVRVTRPGGWIELVEVGFEVEPAGPATKRMVEMMQRLGRSLGLDTTGIVLRSLSEYLHRAGVTDIQQRSVTLPIGEWGDGSDPSWLRIFELRRRGSAVSPRQSSVSPLTSAAICSMRCRRNGKYTRASSVSLRVRSKGCDAVSGSIEVTIEHHRHQRVSGAKLDHHRWSRVAVTWPGRETEDGDHSLP